MIFGVSGPAIMRVLSLLSFGAPRTYYPRRAMANQLYEYHGRS